MIQVLKPREAVLRPEIDRLIGDFGRWGVLREVLSQSFARPRTLSAADLGDHIRRDIGLSPVAERADWRHLR